MIEITELKKSYQGTEVLKDITYDRIQAGDIYGLVGRSGAGKSRLRFAVSMDWNAMIAAALK